MTIRKKHPHKSIEEAVRWAEDQGWRYKEVGNSAHAWGRLLCPLQGREGCALSVWSTPRNPEMHAKQIKHRVKRCLHQKLEMICEQ